ncbi:MAG: hypothetical protein KF874_00350 [Rhizobiaceae bacterium]|nr:hypothetical protein [Rhizobiaceae bacterium]
MRQMFRGLLAAMMALAPISVSTPAMSADALYSAPSAYSGICGTNGVLGRIKSRFSHQVRHVPHLPDVSILDFVNIHENRYEPAYEDSPIARQYCGATVVLSDGSQRDVRYLIEAGMGFAGLGGSNVEFCVSGFDRWFVYSGGCRILR